jgi:site-specific DNA-cytosine methylase
VGKSDLGPVEVGAASVHSISTRPDSRGLHRPAYWSPAVALDPRHRPQVPHRPASTVRREWWRWPQEAHLVEPAHGRYRRLLTAEIARLQSFGPEWFSVPGVGDLDKIRAIGDAVPPRLAHAIFEGVTSVHTLPKGRSLEICAGSGGLALGAAELGIEHELLVDYWPVSGHILRTGKPWSAERVVVTDAGAIDYREMQGKIDLLSGGPPCQPWSTAGLRMGFDDERDLLGEIHRIVAASEPEVFVFENVPGLLSEANRPYLTSVIERLRRPAKGQRYGVAVGVLNAADFGVPQRRRRLFFIGFRNKPSSLAFAAFDRISALATHHAPEAPRMGRQPWEVVASVLEDRVDSEFYYEWPYGDVV